MPDAIATPSAARFTIGDALDSYRIHLRAENKSPNTIAVYTLALRYLETFLEERGMPRDVASIRREHVEAWLADLSEKGKARGADYGLGAGNASDEQITLSADRGTITFQLHTGNGLDQLRVITAAGSGP